MPASPPDEPLLVEARATTRRVARTFALACRLLPGWVRDDVYLLYLVFRTLDDVVDERRPDADRRLAAVERWAAGEPPDRTSREVQLLERLAARHRLPRYAVADFCAGMRHDLERRPVGSEEELDLYCYQVAGTVGVVMASVLGTRSPQALEHAAALGMAMQRTNILRDIDEDTDAGRSYLAEETLARYGSSAPGHREQLLRDQIARADALYEQGMRGIPALLNGRRAIAAAAVMYREILRQIERDGYGRRPGRAVVAPRRRLVLAARHGLLGARGRAGDELDQPAGRAGPADGSATPLEGPGRALS
jgi:phytoene synthase